MKSYRADAARREMRDILTAVERGEHIEIKRYDTPTAIVVPPDWYDTVIAYISATTFTKEAADFYARQREAGGRPLSSDPEEG
jgi:antitoxin (DNA-binding transcriptional repressor) of toxin-antitoxin stability system